MTEAAKATNSNPGEGDKIDLSKYVPKEEFDKLKASSDSTSTELRKALDEAKLKLVDPEYIDYLAKKKDDLAKTEKKLADPTSKEDIADLLALRDKQISQLQHAVQHIAAMLELAEVEKKYKDFDEYRELVKEILDTDAGKNLTFEQAYIVAKSQAKPKEESKKETLPKGSEKPGGTSPSSEFEHKDYKDPQKAGNAAWDEVKAKHGITGDII